MICVLGGGTSGLLVAAGEYLREKHPELLCDAVAREHFHHDTLPGCDFDNTMPRIGSMSKGLHGVDKSLTEWLEAPVGVVAQLMGHKASAIAEKHYTIRPLDLLRVHHEKIEAWILERAGVTFDSASEPGKQRVVVG